MKKSYFGLLLAALVTLGSCTKENTGINDSVDSAKGDMFMTIDISQASTIGTRTSTPNQGIEVGKDRENKLSSALVIFAKEEKVFAVHTLGETDIEGVSSPYAGTFKVDRQAILKDIEDNSEGTGEMEYEIYVIGNPSTEMTETSFAKGSDVQRLFELATDGDKYWSDDHFLMSNAYITKKKIAATDIPLGTHTTKSTAFDLGKVVIQRAMSRFDIDVDTNHTIFSTEPAPEGATYGATDLDNITITMDAVSLINQATKVNLFKVTSTNNENADDNAALEAEWNAYKANPSTTLNFGANPNVSSYPDTDDETATNYVFSPIQTAFSLPLYSSNVSEGKYVSGAENATVQKDLGDLFNTGYSSTTFAAMRDNEEDNTYTHPGSSAVNTLGAYRIWRYAMENTNYDKDNQYHGNTTGVVFRAEITGKKVDGTPISGTMGALYAYNNVFLGNAVALRDYVINQKAESDNSGVYDIVNIRYKAAVEAFNKDQREDNTKFTFETGEIGDEGNHPEIDKGYISLATAESGELDGLATYLVSKEFAIYRPTSNDAQGKYYCYYIYWNRHNDNNQNTIMGPMEFATVRNNVYKLAVTAVHKLGHPGNPNDDPDPDDPGTPDEKDEFYCSVQCVILPWEVRINNIEF